ncbi:unnamed protein product, partial [Schistosoma mattheei]
MNTRKRSCFSPRYGDIKCTELEQSHSSNIEYLSPVPVVYSPEPENEPLRRSHDNVNTLMKSSPTEYTGVCQSSGQRTLRQRTASGTPSESSHGAEAKLSVSVKPRGLLNRRLRRPSKVIPICGLCLGTSELNNKTNSAEEMIACWECGQSGHPTCLKMPPDLVKRISSIRWLCVDCMWTCPICSQSSTECLDIDPRLRSIQVCDQLTQHEIDWMKKAANISGAYLTAPLSFSFQQSPEPIIEHNEASQSSRPSFSMTSKSEFKQSVPSESSQTSNIPATVCKSSKRLIQKSLTDWTLSSKSNRKLTNSMQAPLQTENTINQLPTENEMTKDESPPKRVKRHVSGRSDQLSNSCKMNSTSKTTQHSLKHRLSKLTNNNSNCLKLSNSYNHISQSHQLRRQTMPTSINNKFNVNHSSRRRHLSKYKRSYYYRNKRKSFKREIVSDEEDYDDSVYEADADDDGDDDDDNDSNENITEGRKTNDLLTG